MKKPGNWQITVTLRQKKIVKEGILCAKRTITVKSKIAAAGFAT